MKKIKISYDQEAKQQHERLSWEKLQILGKAVEEYKNIVGEIVDFQLFEKNFFDYAIKEIRSKNLGAEPLNLSDDQIANLYKYDLSKLKSLTETYSHLGTPLKFNKGLFDIDDTIDFNIYTENEAENERYNQAKVLIDALSTLRLKDDTGTHINGINIYKYIATDGENMFPALYYVKQ
jgi:hypothetical protein